MPSTASPANGPLLMDASSAFEAFVHANSLKHIQQLFYQICLLTGVNPSLDHSKVYNVIRGIDRGKANSKAQKLFAYLDKRKAMGVYEGQKVCKNMNVLVVGAGPCGLRAAIECALLGAKVVVVEVRDSFSRNNVLHLWEFVIQDLKALGAKIFYPKFCTGSIEHISIRQLQCILMKVALCLGVEVYEEVGYVETIEPSKDGQIGWRSKFTPSGHILENFEHDVVIGADGKKRALPYYPRNTIRGKMAIGITANFINTKSAAEEKVSEIQGVAYIFNQDFFKRMSEKTGIDLENIVYYKDDTHYFVMCAKKASLIQKGVIKKETYDEDTLLKPENIDYELLYKYALQAADFATNQQLPQLDFAMNHKHEPDVAVFDFTSLQTAMHTTKFFERHGRCYVETIVGDSLHEPFWPTGSGCARGFLGVFDAAWMIKNFGINEKPPVAIIGERENVFKLLAQSSKSNLHKAYHRYSIDPTSRYTSVPRGVELADVAAEQLYTDNQAHRLTDFYLQAWGLQRNDADLKRRCALLRLCAAITTKCHVNVFNFGSSNWSDGIALGALIACFRPDLIDFEHVKQFKGTDDLIDRLFDVLKEHYDVSRPCSTMQEWVNMSDERRYDYVEEVVAALKHETNSCLMMSPGLKSTILSSRKRSKVYKYDPSRVKVSEQITRKADILLNAMVNSGVIQEEEQQPESKQPRQALNRVPSIKEVRNTLPEPEATIHHYTPRPTVDRLNPEKVCFVEQVVKGNYDADRRKAMYDEKYRVAEAKTQKMEKAVIEKMEQKLDDTAQGTLSERNRPVDSLEEKIMRENASKARLIARGEFRSCLDDKFKEIDERIAKAEATLKFADLAGVNSVTGGRPASEAPLSKPIPPPTPPKPAMIPSSSLDDDRENANGRDVVFRAPTSGRPAPSRPQSSPNDLYASVLAQRKNICALCNTQVFLAEKMDIDKVMIHKRCFKCSYCQQPLRIGNCTLDRSLMDDWGRRWYCQQHIGLRQVEKVMRLQKNGKTSARTSVAVVTPTPAIRPPMVAGDRPSDTSKDSSTTSSSLYTEGYRSPASFTVRTINRMKERIAQVATMGTPEQPEFAISRPAATTNAGPSSLTVRPAMGAIAALGSPRLPRASAIIEVPEDQPESEIIEIGTKDSTPGPSGDGDDYHKHVLEPQSSSEISTGLDDDTDSTEHSLETAESEEASNTDDDSDEAEMWNEFNEVLENTLTKAIDPKTTPNVSEEQASKWIQTFNKRKSFLTMMRSPKSVYSTPMVNATPRRGEEFYTPMSTPLTTRPGRAALGNGSAYSTVVNGDDMFENMPSMQRNKLNGSPPDSDFVTPKVSFNDSLPRIGASESGKESGIKARLRSLRSSRLSGERRKTVALEPFSSSGPALSLYADQKERELTAHAEAFEEKEEQQSRVQSGTTTTIEIAPSSSLSGSQMETPKRASFMSRSAEARRLRAKTLTNGINKDDLQVAFENTPPAIAASPQNIARVQKQVTKILRKQEAERQRTEQDVQRALDETEHRIKEVMDVGIQLEDNLGKAPRDFWLLENWLLYVQEYVQLRLKEDDLHRQVRSISLSQKYQMLKAQLMEVQDEDKVEKDKSLMKQMIDTLDEIQQLHTETSKNMRKSTMFDIPQLIEDKHNDFNNFGAVFRATEPLNYDIFLY
uniref:LIM zinc-binding domain-containing protein n=1 Tax=Panagrellus redivivus TaxID=6233 RepID=A0A7E4W775_PANRE